MGLGRAQHQYARPLHLHSCQKHEYKIGTGDSHGCARMRDADLAELFMLIDKITHVIMEE
ncbi:MAG: hypothetical protein DMF22_05250 [Verrucomicrobia bacterium]|nr:MAG: hypothetical protein DMF22_05250 [Verrucomicrobiota bacterium]